MFDAHTADLDKVNSLTKYPSIPTYHAMGDRGVLKPEVQVAFPSGVELVGTEKIDGTNGRIIFLPDGNVFIGSREELLYAVGDLFGNTTLGIVRTLRSTAERLKAEWGPQWTTVFCEVYGGDVPGWKQYTSADARASDFRVFDIITMTDWEMQLQRPIEKIAAWRDHGGQSFCSTEALAQICSVSDLRVAPCLFDGEVPMPVGFDESMEFLKRWAPGSKAQINDGLGRAEGIVVRTPDRKLIAKLRFEDYERTQRKR